MQISIDSHGQKISGNLLKGTPSKPAFLFIQGWRGRQNLGAAQALTNKGHTALTYDMRGNGDSEGDIKVLSRADFLDDAMLLYDYLKANSPDSDIAVVGSSFGAYIACLLTQMRPVVALSLRVPANYPDDGFDQPQSPQIDTDELKAWRTRPLNPNQNKALAALHAFARPIQIIEAENDERVDHRTVQNFIDAAANKQALDYQLMKNAPHSLVNDDLQRQYQELLMQWVERVAQK